MKSSSNPSNPCNPCNPCNLNNSCNFSRALAALFALALFPSPVTAHVGSPNVFFEGQAGPFPVHVIIKPAGVIPGLAEITVRVEGSGIERVTALPIKWNAGRKGAPPPDVAQRVRGETNLFNAQLWFMEGGAQSVELEVMGASGTGHVTIPADAVARRVLTMPKFLGIILAALGLALVALLISIIGASVRESVLEPGIEPPQQRRASATFRRKAVWSCGSGRRTRRTSREPQAVCC